MPTDTEIAESRTPIEQARQANSANGEKITYSEMNALLPNLKSGAGKGK